MGVLPIQRTTAATLIAEDMRDHLLSGAIAPGTRLGDQDLAEATGAPVGTIRAALAELERDGLIVHSLHHGLEVMPITRAELRDIYAARRVFERAGLEAMLATQPVDLSWLQAAVERMGEAAVVGAPRAGVEAEIEAWLTVHPDSTTRALFRALQRQHPGQFPDVQLRTLQRKLAKRRAQAVLTFDDGWLAEERLGEGE